jgi:hypothetical protein
MYAHSLIYISYRTYEIDYWSLFLSFHALHNFLKCIKHSFCDIRLQLSTQSWKETAYCYAVMNSSYVKKLSASVNRLISSETITRSSFFPDEKTKIRNSIQSHKSDRKYKSENGRTRTSEYIRGGIRCHGGVSIPCRSITPAVRPFSRLGKRYEP